MRRFVLLLPVVLVLACASTLGLAWACAAWIEINVPGQITNVQVAPNVWESTLVRSRFGHTQVSFIRGPVRIDPQRGAIDMVGAGNAHDHAQYEQRILAGWPWRSFRCTREVAAFFMQGRFGYFVQRKANTSTVGGIELARGGTMGTPFSWRALPYLPMWPGLVANVIVHSMAWWAILVAPFILRKRLRRRRGRCPACAYDLRGDLASGCPECGWGREVWSST